MVDRRHDPSGNVIKELDNMLRSTGHSLDNIKTYIGSEVDKMKAMLQNRAGTTLPDMINMANFVASAIMTNFPPPTGSPPGSPPSFTPVSNTSDLAHLL